MIGTLQTIETLNSYVICRFVLFKADDNFGFFTYSNQLSAGIFQNLCLKSLNLYNKHKNSIFLSYQK